MESGVSPKIVNSNIQKDFSKKCVITGFVIVNLEISEFFFGQSANLVKSDSSVRFPEIFSWAIFQSIWGLTIGIG